MQNTELIDFTGGINTVVAPHLLNSNEALTLTNVDIKFGSLKSISELSHTVNALAPYFVEYKRNVYYYSVWRSNSKIDDKLYWADGLNTGKILPDGRELPLGIATPLNRLSQTPSGNAGDGVHKGDFKYTYTFYSSTTGIESAPAPLPGYVQLDEQNVSLDNFSPLPTQADTYRIYRIGGYLATFTLVDTIAGVDIPYIDSIDDTLIDGRALATLRTGPPPNNIINFTEMNGRLFGSVGNILYFSGLGAPDSWYTDDFFTMPDDIVAVAKTPAGLLVMGRSYSYLVFGSGPTSFRTKVISDYLGCVSNRSIAYYNGSVIFLGTEGILLSDGYSITNITYRRIDNISDMEVNSAAVANDVYYISFKSLLVPSEELVPEPDLVPSEVAGVGIVGGDSSNGLISVDFRRGNGYSYLYLNHNKISSVGIFRNTLFIVQEGTPQVALQCDDTFNCDDPFCLGGYVISKIGPIISDSYKTLRYISPVLIDGSLSTLKEYDKVRINYVGSFRVKVIFSNIDVVVDTVISTFDNVDLTVGLVESTTDSVAIIGIPNGTNKSNSIQFDIEGIGIVRSIQYSWKGRELP